MLMQEILKAQLGWDDKADDSAFLRECTVEAEPVRDLPESAIPEIRSEIKIHVAMAKKEFRSYSDNTRRLKENRIKNSTLRITELRESSRRIVGLLQQMELSSIITAVKNGSHNHRFANLNLFLKDGLLRVGARLQHSQLPYESKHQLLLLNTSVITSRIITMIHREHLHVGCSGVINILRQKYWSTNARSTVRKVFRGCVTCFRVNPKTVSQQMGDLPSYRVNAAPTFERVGLDYARPILLQSGIRRVSSWKGYICIFVCMVTYGINLEAVENLTTEAFLAAFKRVMSRRGIPHGVFSDNGTNFVGANAEIKEMRNAYKKAVATQGIR
ncbi:uncharacterized protein LOC118513869 isoform X1 [Anopheles stephensi]|uniref:uncharacterized protein LOC118513869 isoform X1 n=1 Tax=Anopheles stephensi TaxID=30069 RepID=UPI0016589A33|nr:uncharacterized protein LOC118513869 isoform X1 [Anopheles stephensi]XP_035916078.1 uncharacterized protein LOC118513869 isoform X1 [Anopheles stephensi]